MHTQQRKHWDLGEKILCFRERRTRKEAKTYAKIKSGTKKMNEERDTKTENTFSVLQEAETKPLSEEE